MDKPGLRAVLRVCGFSIPVIFYCKFIHVDSHDNIAERSSPINLRWKHIDRVPTFVVEARILASQQRLVTRRPSKLT
jgi:hypothetical protein